jgi:predicted metal-dependent peptidase
MNTDQIPEGVEVHAFVPMPEEGWNMDELQDTYLMARAAACRAMPYMAQLLVAMPYTYTSSATSDHQDPSGMVVHHPTICVAQNGHIYLHPDFVTRLIANGGGAQALGYILAHEAMHVLFRHHKRKLDLFKKEGDNFDQKLDGLAADLSINPSLSAIAAKPKPNVIWIKEPTGDHTGVLPKNFGMEDGLTYEQYYYGLKQQSQSNKKKPKASGQPAQGCSPDSGQGDGSGNASAQAKKAMREGQGMSQAKMDSLAHSTLQKAKEHESRNRGTVPAGIMQEIENGFVEPKVRWQDVLKAQVLHDLQHVDGSDSLIWTKNSRKQGGIGHGPGTARLPGFVEYRPTVTVVADTSGSMGADLEHIRDETLGIVAECGADVDFIACDTVAHDGGKVRNAAQIAANLKGGGGTDMNPALDLAKDKRSDIVVCITDGYIGDFGEYRGYKLIFCVVPSGSTESLKKVEEEGWGAVIQIEKE